MSTATAGNPQAQAPAGASPAAAAGVNPPANPQTGARNPGRSNQARVLDYDTEKDVKFYNKAIAKLDGDPYDGTGLPTFLKSFGAKAKQFEWTINLMIPRVTVPAQPTVTRNLLKQYGEITRAEVQAHALTYLGNGTRLDQNSDMIFNCLRMSLSEKVKSLVFTEPERYTFMVNGEEFEDGPCFLKAIIDKTVTNTLANTSKARENLISLREYMESLPDSNITEFNNHVKKQLETLAAGGETTTELITNLFKGYSYAKDKDFRMFIKSKKQAYFEKSYHIDPNGHDFMELVENYYKDAVTYGEWMLPDDEQSTILALQAAIAKIKVNKNNGSNKSRNPGRPNPKFSPNQGNEGVKGKDWKSVPPKNGENRTLKKEGKIYHWCTYHKQWTLHKISECRLKAQGERTGTQKKFEKKEMQLRAYQALMQDSSKEADEPSEADPQSEAEESQGSNTSG
jgi:hypothetical protein